MCQGHHEHNERMNCVYRAQMILKALKISLDSSASVKRCCSTSLAARALQAILVMRTTPPSPQVSSTSQCLRNDEQQ